jgi:hypothetical protein
MPQRQGQCHLGGCRTKTRSSCSPWWSTSRLKTSTSATTRIVLHVGDSLIRAISAEVAEGDFPGRRGVTGLARI